MLRASRPSGPCLRQCVHKITIILAYHWSGSLSSNKQQQAKNGGAEGKGLESKAGNRFSGGHTGFTPRHKVRKARKSGREFPIVPLPEFTMSYWGYFTPLG